MNNNYDWDVSDVDDATLYELYGRSYKLDLAKIVNDLIDVRKWLTKYLINKIGFQTLFNMVAKEFDGNGDAFFVTTNDGGSLEVYEFGSDVVEYEYVPVVGAPTYTIKEEPFDGWNVNPHDNIFIPLLVNGVLSKYEQYSSFGFLQKNFGTHRVFLKKWSQALDDESEKDYHQIDMNLTNSAITSISYGTLFTPYDIELSYADSEYENVELDGVTPIYLKGTHELFMKTEATIYPYHNTLLPNCPISYYGKTYIGANGENYATQSASVLMMNVGTANIYGGSDMKHKIYLEIDFINEVNLFMLDDIQDDVPNTGFHYATPDQILITLDDGSEIYRQPLSQYEKFRTPISPNNSYYGNPLVCYQCLFEGEHTIKVEVIEDNTFVLMGGYTLRDKEMKWWR